MYSYDETEKIYSQFLFVGDEAYKENKSYWGLSWYQYAQGETILSATEKDGVIYITAEMTLEDNLKAAAENYGCTREEINKIVMYYEVDAESYIIQKLETKLELTNGETVTCQKVQKIENSRNYDTDNIVKAATEGDIRKITLIENSGTDDEQVFEFSLPKGVRSSIILSSEYEQVVYADLKCTTQMEATNDYTIDITGYIRKSK